MEQEFARSNPGLEQMAAAVSRLEQSLEKTLRDHASLQEKHRILAEAHQALKARTESVGAELDQTIDRLKELITSDGPRPAGGQ